MKSELKQRKKKASRPLSAAGMSRGRGSSALSAAERQRWERLEGLVAGLSESVAGLKESVGGLKESVAGLVAAAMADRGRLARLEAKYAKELAEKKGNQRRLARALENEFAAGLPRALLATKPRIAVRGEDIQMRARKDNNSREFDFVAPNGALAAVGEVKTHLTYDDVDKFHTALTVDFRKLFPEYAELPLYGVVAGAEIDAAAVARARELGFIVLRLDGAAPHPLTAAGYAPTAYPPLSGAASSGGG